jgi:hypothetical protein
MIIHAHKICQVYYDDINFDTLQVRRDFPSLQTWAANLSGVLLNQSFRHERMKNNTEQEFPHVNQHIFNNENYNSMQNVAISSQCEESRLNNDETPPKNNRIGNQTALNFLNDSLPNTPHNVHIIHALRTYRDEITQRLSLENPYHRKTITHNNNKLSLRFILQQLISSRYLFFDEIIALLYTLPFKSDDLDGQTSDINDVIRIIRDENGKHTCSIPYIKTNNDDFNDSQASIDSNLPSRVSCQKPNRSAD